MTTNSDAAISCESYETQCQNPAGWVIVYSPERLVRIHMVCPAHHVPDAPLAAKLVPLHHEPSGPRDEFADFAQLLNKCARAAQRYHNLAMERRAAGAGNEPPLSKLELERRMADPGNEPPLPLTDLVSLTAGYRNYVLTIAEHWLAKLNQ